MTRMKLKKLLKVLPDDEMIVINEWVPLGEMRAKGWRLRSL